MRNVPMGVSARAGKKEMRYGAGLVDEPPRIHLDEVFPVSSES